MNYYIDALKNYAVFTGRTKVRDFWMFALFNFIFTVVANVLGHIGLGLISFIYALAMIVPSFAIGARRLHDTGRSGWWQLIVVIPLIGAIILIILFIVEGQAGANQYGPDPKGEQIPVPQAPLV